MHVAVRVVLAAEHDGLSGPFFWGVDTIPCVLHIKS